MNQDGSMASGIQEYAMGRLPTEAKRVDPPGTTIDHESPKSNQLAANVRLGYRRWLDGLRGLAILMVLGCHLGLLPAGFLGVDIFFVLSGFLITCMLAEEQQIRGTISLRHFYLRRALRLLPAFLLLVSLAGVDGLLLKSPVERAARWREMIIAACYITNWPSLYGWMSMPLLGHTWSLSIEEQYYLIWPILLCIAFRLRLSRQRILWLTAAPILLSFTWRLVLFERFLPAGSARSMWRLYGGLDTRADSLLVGSATGLLFVWRMLPGSRRFVFWSGAAAAHFVLVLGFMAWKSRHYHFYYYDGVSTVIAFMVAVIIVRLLQAPSRIAALLLQSAPLVGVGRISYGLYLFHIPAMHWLWVKEPGARNPWNSALVVSATFGMALLPYDCVERPCLKLKNHLRPGRLRFRPTRDVPAAATWSCAN
jgi:peptidoglycan/LPS O-acetylase OafA/YrhL